MKLKLSLLYSTKQRLSQFTTMSNSLVEHELQDICTFRQIIVNSNQKIHHHLLRKKCPIKLIEHCDYDNPIINNINTQFQCVYDEKTTDYFSESDYQLNPIVTGFYQPNSKDHYLANYLNQYETNRLKSLLDQPLNQIRDIQNRYQNINTSISSRKKIQFRPIEVPVFQNIHFQNRQCRKSNYKIHQKKIFDYNLSVNRIQYDDYVKHDPTCFEEKTNNNLLNKIKFLSNSNFIVPQSQRKLLKIPPYKNQVGETQKKLSKSKNKYITIDKQTRKKRVQKKDINQISLRIMKRIQLSFAVTKSAQDSYLAVYKKELKERSQIIDKIMSQHKELCKAQKRSTSIKK